MTHRRSTLLAVAGAALAAGLLLGPPLQSGSTPLEVDLVEFSHSLAQLSSRVQAATVLLEVTKRAGDDEDDEGNWERIFGDSKGRGRVQGTGSGFVVDAVQGYVVTNAHVVGNRSALVRATLEDGRQTPADVVAVDPYTDLAVVKIEPGFARRELHWGDSDSLRPGDMVMAVGSPFGLSGTTSFGVLSGTSRIVPGLPPNQYHDYLQSDAFIDQGSSGGPLVNMSGAVVGVNTAIAGTSWQGISYSVPSTLARYVAGELIKHGRVRRGWLGVELAAVTATYAEQVGMGRPYGARVREITDKSPAKKSGLRRGDVILSVNGVEVTGIQNLRARVGAMAPGSSVKFRIWRDESPMTLRVVLGENTDL
jgi:serine protease Do